MTLTLGNLVTLVLIFITIAIAVLVIIIAIDPDDMWKALIVGLFGTCVVTTLIAVGMSWYNTHTASGIRAYKDFQSEIENGINREITITAEDGREIFHYEGKVDIETNHEDNYIKFESEDGRRYIIYYGIQDTILIVEKEKGE